MAFAEDNAVFAAATRDVALGEELTISYVDASGADDERREELRETYGFECARAVSGAGKRRRSRRKPRVRGEEGGEETRARGEEGGEETASAAKKAGKKPRPRRRRR